MALRIFSESVQSFAGLTAAEGRNASFASHIRRIALGNLQKQEVF
jgi:hypothetical protein